MIQTDSPLSLDGLTFRMTSSSASEVDPENPTVFVYRQEGAMLWGEYTGDTVSTGRFVGRLTGHTIDITFAHALVSNGTVMTGSASSTVEERADGLLYLVEVFDKNGESHVSECQQVS